MDDETQREQSTPEVQARIRASFERQGLMRHIAHIGPEHVHIVLPSRPEGARRTATSTPAPPAPSPTARAAMRLTLFPENTSVLTVEYKINLLAARGATGRAEGIARESAALGEWVAAPVQLAATTAARAITGIVKRLLSPR